MRKRRTRKSCDQCQAAMINGVFCHEHGCPNSRKTWVPERSAWVLYLECHVCGCEVEAGESCDCQAQEFDPDPEITWSLA